MINIIVAIARNNEIGRNGDLLWHIPEDLRHFKTLTQGHPVIMGRKTWESLPKRPLPGRLNIVITRQSGYSAPGAMTAPSLAEALNLSKSDTFPKADQELFIIGGGQLYKEALPLADVLEITHIEADAPDADTFFPDISPEEWELVSETFPEQASDLKFSFRRYLRR